MSVWSDSRVIDLSKKFVPATDEVWRLQRGTDPECVSFQKMANLGHYGGRPGATRQGIYVCAPSGKFLASVNSTNPGRVIEMMKDGLEAWRNLPDEDRGLADDSKIEPKHRWEDSYPENGLVLNVFTRDLPQNEDPASECSKKWNQDRVWFSAEEVQQWLPETLQAGSKCTLGRAALERLVRFHLVDTVKGQTSPFSPRDISDATEIEIEVIEKTSRRVKLAIQGTTLAEANRRSRGTIPHGVSAHLIGYATFDLETSRFTDFEMVATGKRWGYTQNNGRRRDPAESPVGFVFRLSSPDEPRIAPAFIGSYQADWIMRP